MGRYPQPTPTTVRFYSHTFSDKPEHFLSEIYLSSLDQYCRWMNGTLRSANEPEGWKYAVLIRNGESVGSICH